MIKRILVGIADRPYSISATHYAAELAKRLDAKLTAISVMDEARIADVGPVALGGGAFAKDLRESRHEQASQAITEALDGFVRLCESEKVRYGIVRESGDPLTSFIHASRYHDLVIAGLHHLFEHGVMAEPPDSLIRLVSAGVHPLLAVSPDHQEIRRILVAYSGSVESAKTLRCFTQMHTIWPDKAVRIVVFGSKKSDGQKRLEDAREYMQCHGLDPETDFATGSAKQLLAYAGDWNADMIVLGNSAKNLLRRRVFGETALHTIRHSEVPLFLSQ